MVRFLKPFFVAVALAVCVPFGLSALDYEVGASVGMGALAFKGTLTGFDLDSVSGMLLGDAGLSYEDSPLVVYSSAVRPYASFQTSSLKGEVKGSLAFSKIGDGKPSSTFVLDKAYAKFRFPSFGGRKMTVAFGKAPLSWGVGSYYRVGDVLLSSADNSRAGEDVERTAWVLEASQGLGLGFAGDVAATLPLEGGDLSVGATLRKSFSGSFLKEVYGFYGYCGDFGHKAAVAFDLSAYFDIVLGVEGCFKAGSNSGSSGGSVGGSSVGSAGVSNGEGDYRVVANLMRQYSVETEESSCSIGLYLSAEACFQTGSYETMCAVSVLPAERVDLYLSVVNSFVDGSYRGVVSSLSTSFLVSDGVKASLLCLYGYNDVLNRHSGAVSLSLEATL